MDSERIPLRAMSARRRRIVERHLGLVHLVLRRHEQLCEPDRTGREPDELFQEGCLALIQAIHTHDPIRHGYFAAFAMARIHYAISRFVHEFHSAVRIPFSTQIKQRREWKRNPGPQSRIPFPKVFNIGKANRQAGPSLSPDGMGEGSPSEETPVTIGERIRERYDLALREVVHELKHPKRCNAGLREVVERCCEERWQVPEPEMRTSMKQLARILGCSKGRIVHCEERFRGKLARLLEADEEYQALDALARSHPMGMRARLNAQSPDRHRPDRSCNDSDVAQHGQRNE